MVEGNAVDAMELLQRDAAKFGGVRLGEILVPSPEMPADNRILSSAE